MDATRDLNPWESLTPEGLILIDEPAQAQALAEMMARFDQEDGLLELVPAACLERLELEPGVRVEAPPSLEL